MPQDCLFRAYLLHEQLHCLCSFNLRFGKNKSYRIITMQGTSFAFQIWLIFANMKKKNWNSAVLLHVHTINWMWHDTLDYHAPFSIWLKSYLAAQPISLDICHFEVWIEGAPFLPDFKSGRQSCLNLYHKTSVTGY